MATSVLYPFQIRGTMAPFQVDILAGKLFPKFYSKESAPGEAILDIETWFLHRISIRFHLA